MEDILEPLELYRTTFKAAHARHTSELFEELVSRSGVDEAANAKTVGELRALDGSIAADSSKRRWWEILRAALLIGALACGVMATRDLFYASEVLFGILYALGLVLGLVVVVRSLNPRIKSIRERVRTLKEQRSRKQDEAWSQMEALNGLYHWGMFAQLIKRTVPRIEVDPYFTVGRLSELRHSFGWRDQINRTGSVLCAHSGSLNGNPLVIGKALHHWVGTKTYTGSLTIRWTESVRDSSGRMQLKTRTQTLRASIDKPFPRYVDRPFVIYGNEAAPDLCFSRKPSELSGLGEGILDSWRKASEVKKLEARSRDMKNDFTIMSNREFDSLFGATDRDHEVQFRLLFTALAQQEMVKLLKDKTEGYGDDFLFTKAGMINVVEPAHLGETDISCDPNKFRAFSLADARKFFNEYHNELFRSVFFGLAPLLAIPLYQQHRSHADIYQDASARESCFWEHESIANHFGDEAFKHPECITRSIMKTDASVGADGYKVVRVTAFGYRGVKQVDYVRRLGGDGRYHNVPVEWVEYIDVEQGSEMVLKDQARFDGDGPEPVEDGGWRAMFQKLGADPDRAVLRRSIIAALR